MTISFMNEVRSCCLSQLIHAVPNCLSFFSIMPQASKMSQGPSTIESSPWLTSPSHSGLVSIGTHSLHLQVSGPSRKDDQPVAIIIQGLGSQISSWAAVTRLLSPHIRTYSYSRSGFTPSEVGPLLPTTDNIADELILLLQAADIKPPYILIAHSWGGIILPKFVVKVGQENIAGVVFVEPNQVQTLEILDWRPISMWISDSGIDVLKVSGMEQDRRLNDEEWDAYLKDKANEQNKKAGEKEWAEYEASFQDLKTDERAQELVFDCVVTVIHGWNGKALRKLYDAAVEKGYGTKEEQVEFAKFLDSFDEKDLELQLGVGSFARVVRSVPADNSGHEVQMTDPEVIVDEVRWILEHPAAMGSL